MRNSWIGLTLGMVVVFSSLCFAALPPSAIAVDSSVVVAKYKFGSPNVRGDKFYFPNGVVVEVDNRQNGAIEEINAQNDGAGVAVGMGESELSKRYGKADSVEKFSDGVDYKYFSADGRKEITFKVSNGVIRQIECEQIK